MKTSSIKRHSAGFVSFLLVLTTGAVLTALMFAAYRRALGAQVTESKVQLRTDYSEKEETILRSIVAVTPNCAMRAMQTDSANIGDQLGWPGIFASALTVANSQTSMSAEMKTALKLPGVMSANTGDGALNNLGSIFAEISPDPTSTPPTTVQLISAGINRAFLGAYPPPLTSTDAVTNGSDRNFPLISQSKKYGVAAQSYLNSPEFNGNQSSGYGVPVDTYSSFNCLRYPAINFGYARPGESFVGKRNWWAFSMNVSDHDRSRTGIVRPRRNFVLSIYEIPSQLPISAASSMTLGQYAGNSAWQNFSIDGGISVGNANVVGTTALNRLALRRGMSMSTGSSVGGWTKDMGDPFSPGARETYQQKANELPSGATPIINQTNLGGSLPISLASESGRAAFIPISRGKAFFDRFDSSQNDGVEPTGARNHVGRNSLSATSWNNYSIGAQQCAMRLDVVAGPAGGDFTTLRFQYLLKNGSRGEETIRFGRGLGGILSNLPTDYVDANVSEGGTLTFDTSTDIAYGGPTGYTIIYGVQGPITFNNSTFGDPLPGVVKRGFVRKNGAGIAIRSPFEQRAAVGGQVCIAVFPERIPEYLKGLAIEGTPKEAAKVDKNNSLAVNVDYSVSGMNDTMRKPSIPCRVSDYGVVLKECKDLRTFLNGFSLVTNLRLFIGDDFNQVRTPPNFPPGFPANGTPANPIGTYLPPCSLFAPEKRYGAEVMAAGAKPLTVVIRGQVGSLASADKIINDDVIQDVRPLDAKGLGDIALLPSNVTSNLTQIRHPAELPPITMMNWLVLLEEVR